MVPGLLSVAEEHCRTEHRRIRTGRCPLMDVRGGFVCGELTCPCCMLTACRRCGWCCTHCVDCWLEQTLMDWQASHRDGYWRPS